LLSTTTASRMRTPAPESFFLGALLGAAELEPLEHAVSPTAPSTRRRAAARRIVLRMTARPTRSHASGFPIRRDNPEPPLLRPARAVGAAAIVASRQRFGSGCGRAVLP